MLRDPLTNYTFTIVDTLCIVFLNFNHFPFSFGLIKQVAMSKSHSRKGRHVGQPCWRSWLMSMSVGRRNSLMKHGGIKRTESVEVRCLLVEMSRLWKFQVMVLSNYWRQKMSGIVALLKVSTNALVCPVRSTSTASLFNLFPWCNDEDSEKSCTGRKDNVKQRVNTQWTSYITTCPRLDYQHITSCCVAPCCQKQCQSHAVTSIHKHSWNNRITFRPCQHNTDTIQI